MKRLMNLFTVFALFLCMNPLTTNAGSVFAHDNKKEMERTTYIFNMRMEELETQANELLNLSEEDAINLQIAQVSTIYDFSGNEYTLIECSPSGYMIYHNESGIFVEASAVAESPYSGYMTEKIYGGPNEYYVKSTVDDEVFYTYTQSDEVIPAREMSAYSETSELLNDMLVANKNMAVLNYIENDRPIDVASPMSSTVGKLTVVNNYGFFSKMTSPGYTTINGSGICGYIAAGMLLTYEQVTNGGSIVDPAYYNVDSSSICSIDSSFPRDLYTLGTTLGYGTSTTSVAIHYTVEKYLDNKGISASHTSLYSPIASNVAIVNKINDDRPVIWFGLINNNSHDNQKNITHAVVVYGYDYSILSGYSYVAHFGWNNANIVSFSGVLGSMYTFTVN